MIEEFRTTDTPSVASWCGDKGVAENIIRVWLKILNNDFMNKPSREIPTDRLRPLYHRLNEAGFENVRLELSDDSELAEFSFQRGANVESTTSDSAYACVLRILREAGFGIGFEELALTKSLGTVSGAFLVRPLAEICG